MKPNASHAFLAAAVAALGIAGSARAASYTWGGGTLDWTDTSASGWNGGPPVSGDTAIINGGTVTPTTATQEAGVAITLGGSGVLQTADGQYFDGFASLSFVNGGTLTATGGNTSWGAGALGSLSVSGSYAAGSTINGTYFNLFSGSTFTVADVSGNADADLTVSAVLENIPSQTIGSLTKAGLGTLVLSGANTYSGETNFGAGVINVATLSNYGVAGSLGNRASDSLSNVGFLFTGGTLQYTGSTAQSTDRQIRMLNGVKTFIDASGTGGGTLAFTSSIANADQWHTGGTRTLTLTGSNTGNNTFAINIQSHSSGQTSLVKSGDGRWDITNSHNSDAVSGTAGTFGGYGGGTTISGGTLGFTNNAIGGGVISFTGNATLSWGVGNTQDVSSGTGGGVTRSLKIEDGVTATFDTGANNVTLGAAIAVGALQTGALTKDGAGKLTLTGANTYTGTTTITAGTLQIGNGGTVGALGATPIVNNSALTLHRSDALFTFANLISGSGSVTNLGSGILDITTNNTYLGGTFINAGILRLRTDLGGGARLGSGSVTVANGASYEIWAPSAQTLANNIVLNGATGIAGRPALNQDGGAGKVTISGTVTLSATSDIGIGGTSSNHMDITGVISGVANAGIIVQERTTNNGFNAILTLAGANTYTGPTTLMGGTLKAGVASVANVSGAFGKNSAVTLANAANTNLDITGFNTQIGSLTGGGASGGNVILGAATLTVGGDNTSPAAYAGVISGTGGVTKIGSGTQILTGTNTYTGQTTVSAGTLTLAGSSSGTLGSIQVGGSGTPALNIQAGSYNQGANGFYVGVGGGPGVVNHSGGALTWNSTNLQLLIGNGSVNGTYNLSGGSVTTLTGVATRGVMLGVNTGTTATFNLSGTGALTVVGTSRLMIGRSDSSSPNTVTRFFQTGGTATISNLTMGGPNAAAGSNNNATLDLSGGTFTVAAFPLLSAAAGDVSTINIGGTADVTLPAFPTARGSGATATLHFDGGTLRPAAASASYLGGLSQATILAGGAKLDVPGGRDITITQDLEENGSSPGGGLTKTGTGVLTLSGSSAYFGATQVQQGKLVVSGSIPSTGLIHVSAGATLGGSGYGGVTTVANTGRLAPGDANDNIIDLAGLTLNSDSELDFELGAPWQGDDPFTPDFYPGIHNDHVFLTGALVLSGRLNVVARGGGGFATHTLGSQWLLMKTDGSISGSVPTLGTMEPLNSPELAYAIQTTLDGRVLLVVVPEAATSGLLLLGLFFLCNLFASRSHR